jgi:hypothetical protein
MSGAGISDKRREELTDTHRLDVCWKKDSSGEVLDDWKRMNDRATDFFGHEGNNLQFMMGMK